MSQVGKKAGEETEEDRILRKQYRKDALDTLADGPLLYGPHGIDDSL